MSDQGGDLTIIIIITINIIIIITIINIIIIITLLASPKRKQTESYLWFAARAPSRPESTALAGCEPFSSSSLGSA